MPTISFVEPSGASHAVSVDAGENIMRGAINNGIEGIVGECGGGLACATCHCYVDQEWLARTGEPSQAERDMLECASAEVRPNSRLSCQIVVTDALDGLVIHLPASQF